MSLTQWPSFTSHWRCWSSEVKEKCVTVQILRAFFSIRMNYKWIKWIKKWSRSEVILIGCTGHSVWVKKNCDDVRRPNYTCHRLNTDSMYHRYQCFLLLLEGLNGTCTIIILTVTVRIRLLIFQHQHRQIYLVVTLLSNIHCKVTEHLVEVEKKGQNKKT